MSSDDRGLDVEKKSMDDRKVNKKAQEIYARVRLVLKGTHAEIADEMSKYLDGPLDKRILSNWSTGRSMPTIEQLGAVALIAKVKFDWLILGERAEKDDAPAKEMLNVQDAIEASRAKLAALRTYLDGATRQVSAASQLLSDADDDLKRTTNVHHQAHS